MPLTVVGPAPLLDWDRDGLTVELPTLGPTRVGLRGRHQAANVAVADALLDALAIAGIASVDADARRRGYADVRWPGRLELLEVDGREVLLDGAHNPAGAGGPRRGARPTFGRSSPRVRSRCSRRPWPTRTSLGS